MKPLQYKPLYLFKPGTRYHCKRCGNINTVRGNTYLKKDDPVRSEDGRMAYRIFWICDGASHIKFRGYSRPVDFSKIHGKVENPKDIPDFNDEREWED